MIKSNYELVLRVVEGFEDERILNDFKVVFKEGENVSENDYFEFCRRYMDDISEDYYIRLNWEFIISGGDESVYDDDYELKLEKENKILKEKLYKIISEID